MPAAVFLRFALLFSLAIIVCIALFLELSAATLAPQIFYDEQVSFHQAIAPPIFHRFLPLVAVHTCVLGKTG